MKMAIGAALLAGLPVIASAQQTAVPAIAQANATAAASATAAAPFRTSGHVDGRVRAIRVESGHLHRPFHDSPSAAS